MIENGFFAAVSVLLTRQRGFHHFVAQIGAFARAFADAAENRNAAVFLRDVVDEFSDQNGFADTRAAEQTNFAAARIRLQQVDDFDTGFKRLNRRT